jgi:hypothetical protein
LVGSTEADAFNKGRWSIADARRSASSGQTTISNVGVTQLNVQSTYTLQNPYVGALKTIYRTASLTTAVTAIAPQTGGAFNSMGGTQVLVLQPTTAGTGADISVTLIGESTAQWRIVSAYPSLAPDSTTAGVRVTT